MAGTEEPVRVPTQTLMESLHKTQRFSRDIRDIMDKVPVNRTHLARALGVSREEIWKWEKGIHQPQESVIIHIVSSWAEDLRNAQVS